MAVNSYPKRIGDSPRVELVVKEFNNLIEDQGTRVRLTPSILCPVRTSVSDHAADTNHNLNCPICDGSEIVDLHELAIEDWVFIQGIKIEKMFQMQGVLDLKVAFMTVRSADRVGYWWKVEIIDFGSMFNELIVKKEGDTDKVRYPYFDAMEGSFFAMVGPDGVRYEKDTDYTVSGKTITWLSANRPETGRLVSFLYPVLPTFRVLELMHDNRYYYDGFKKPTKTPIQLPQQCHIRWDFMAKKDGSDVQL